MPDTPAVLVRSLRFTYRGADRPALDGVDLEVAPGEYVAVLGASGMGKSTLCCALGGLIPHFVRGEMTGEVRVFGVETASRPVSQIAEEVGLLFQEFESQLFCTSVELEVAFGPENLQVAPPEIRQRVSAALAAVGLAGLEPREPATLSGGQKQRLALAAVLALRPRVLVMDEPTTDLDPAGRAEVFAVARRLREEQGIAVVVAEHETEAAFPADRVVLLDRGRIAASGPPEVLLTQVDRLEEIGIAPPAVAQLLARLGEPPCLDLAEAAEQLRNRGDALDKPAAAAIHARDEARAAGYGAPLFEVQDVEHRYAGGTLALTGIDLTVREGEFVALAGANGSGKTTLAQHLNGLLRPTKGMVRVAGQATAGVSVTTLARTVGYVFQNPDHQLFAETIADEVAFGPRNLGVAAGPTSGGAPGARGPAPGAGRSAAEDAPPPPPDVGTLVRERVEEALAAVGLAGREGEDPFSLTKGERQRVAVASVLATRPRALILDEPTTGLDARERRSLMTLVRRLNEAGHTVLCITHHLEIVAEYAHRMVVLRQGRVFLDGPTREILAREPELAEAGLRPPDLVRLGSRLGFPFLTVEEGVSVLKGVMVR
jgi:energy-coupling factor transporter ATP-binding protein EcfA2